MNENRERARHYGVILAVVMLALLMPLTIFLAQKENDIRSRASVAAVAPSGPVGVSAPPFYGVGPCPPNDFCPSPGISPNVSGANPNPSSGARPSTSVNNPNPLSAPCEVTGASLATNKKEKKSKHKEHSGGISGFMEALLNFFIELINMLIKLLGGAPIQVPNQGNPQQPNNPGQQPAPEAPNPGNNNPEPEPCSREVEPSVAPTNITTQPSISVVPPSGVNPSTIPVPSSASPSGSNVPVGSKVVFVGDYEAGDFSQWINCQNVYLNGSCAKIDQSKYSAKIVTNGEQRQGNYAARFELRDGDIPNFGGGERTEVRAPGTAEVKEGDERWYEWSTKFDANFTNPKGWGMVILQWHSGSGSPPVAVEVSPNNGDIMLTDNSGKNKRIGPMRKGQWTDYVLHIKFSGSSSIGFVEVWENGVNTVKKTNQSTMASAENFFKQGIYRDESNTATHILYHDGLRVTAP